MLEGMSFKEIVEFAIKTEEIGARFYERMAAKFSDNSELEKVFTKLSRDEKVYGQQFAKVLEETPERDREISNAPESKYYLRAMSISEFFSRESGPFADRDEIETRDQALGQALAFEKATLGFYRGVEDVMGSHEALREIIDAEKQHITTITKILLTDGKLRSLQDQF